MICGKKEQIFLELHVHCKHAHSMVMYIYICSGFVGKKINMLENESHVHQYETNCDTWLLRTKLPSTCGLRSMCQDDKNIYFLSGCKETDVNRIFESECTVYRPSKHSETDVNRIFESECTVYRPSEHSETDSITSFNTQWIMRGTGSVCSPCRTLIMCGGYGTEIKGKIIKYTDDNSEPCDTIKIYSFESEEWIESNITLYKAVCDCQAEVLVLPHTTLM